MSVYPTIKVRFVDLKQGDVVAISAKNGGQYLVKVVDIETAYRSQERFGGERYRIGFDHGRYQYVSASEMADLVVPVEA